MAVTVSSRSTPGRKSAFWWSALMASDHLGLPRPERGVEAGPGADLGQGRAPGAAADDAGRLAHALAPLRPAAWVGSAGRRPRPAASAGGPRRRGRRSAPAPAARRRPGRSWRRCRCSRPAAGRGRRSRARRASCLQRRAHRAVGGDAAGHDEAPIAAPVGARHRPPWPGRCARRAGGRWRAWTAAARSRRSVSSVSPVGQPRGGGLQAGEGEVAVLAAQQRARQGKAGRVAALRQPFQRRAAGIGAGPGPRRSCRRPRRRRRRWSSPAARQAPTPGDVQQLAMAAGDQQQQERIGRCRRPAAPRRRGPPGGSPRSAAGPAPGPWPCRTRARPSPRRPGPGPAVAAIAVEIGEAESSASASARRDNGVDGLHMGAGGDLRHHPAIGRMLGDLAEHDAGAAPRRRHRPGAPPPRRSRRSWSRCRGL